MKKEKLGFLKKLFLVITDFRTYPFLVKNEKFLKSILYLITLTIVVSLIFTANIFLKMDSILKKGIENYHEIMPEFELSNGYLDVDTKYNEKAGNEFFLVINTDYTYEEYTKTKEYSGLVIYNTIILVNNDKIMVEIGNEPVYEIIFKDFEYMTNKDKLYEEIINVYEGPLYISYLITLYISVFIGYFMAILIKILFLSCLISIICSLTGIRLNFKNYIKLAIYSYTLPLIIEVVAFCLGVGNKDYTYYTILFLTYIYIIYAIRAVRLDAFIMMFSNKSIKKHTSTEFENELKKYNELINNNEEDKMAEEKNENKDKSDK